MYILRIEHAVMNYEGWKKAFDSDPAGRQKSGVRVYRIIRPVDDPNYVIIDLEFDTTAEAEAFLKVMRNIWGEVAGKIIMNPQVHLAEIVETGKY